MKNRREKTKTMNERDVDAVFDQLPSEGGATVSYLVTRLELGQGRIIHCLRRLKFEGKATFELRKTRRGAYMSDVAFWRRT